MGLGFLGFEHKEFHKISAFRQGLSVTVTDQGNDSVIIFEHRQKHEHCPNHKKDQMCMTVAFLQISFSLAVCSLSSSR